MSKKNSKDLSYKGLTINFDPQKKMFSLVDMWKASGSNPSKKPTQWLRQMGTAELLLALCRKYSQDIQIEKIMNPIKWPRLLRSNAVDKMVWL